MLEHFEKLAGLVRDLYLGFRYWLALKLNRPDSAGYWQEEMEGNREGYFHRKFEILSEENER